MDWYELMSLLGGTCFTHNVFVATDGFVENREHDLIPAILRGAWPLFCLWILKLVDCFFFGFVAPLCMGEIRRYKVQLELECHFQMTSFLFSGRQLSSPVMLTTK